MPTDAGEAANPVARALLPRQRARVVRVEDENYCSECPVSVHGRAVENIDEITSGWMETFQPPNVLVWQENTIE